MTRFADLWPVPKYEGHPQIDADLYQKRERDVLYRERTFVVAALARVIFDDNHGMGNPSAWLARHVGPWEEDWRGIVVVDLGRGGLVTWHIHDSELPLFRFLNERKAGDYVYDGHSTDEKYRRIWEFVTGERE